MRYRMLVLTLVALLCSVLLSACGGGGGGASASASRSDPTVRLSLSVQTTSQQVTVTLSADNARALHQLACRIAYNPQALRYRGSVRGSLVDQRAVFFTTARASAYVPVAFTYHAGEQTPASSGPIATLTFDTLDASQPFGLHVLEDGNYLIARDDGRHPLALTISGGTP